jgi:hypothetical protein
VVLLIGLINRFSPSSFIPFDTHAATSQPVGACIFGLPQRLPLPLRHRLLHGHHARVQVSFWLHNRSLPSRLAQLSVDGSNGLGNRRQFPHLIEQSIHQPIDRSINQPINNPINQPTN